MTVSARPLTARLQEGSFARNVLVLLTGTTRAQAVPILVSPLLARLYGPVHMGTYALFSSIALTLSVPASGLYELSIVLPKEDEDGASACVTALIATFVFALAVAAVAGFFASPIAEKLGNPAVAPWLILLGPSVLLLNVYQAFSYWSNRKREFHRLSISRVCRSLAIAGSNVGFGLAQLGAFGLVVGAVAGQGVGAFVLTWQSWRHDHAAFRAVTWHRIRAAAWRFREFPLFAAPTSLLNTAASQAPVFLLTRFYDAGTAGQFGLAATVIAAPGVLLSSSVQQVYYQRIASLRNSHPERLRPYLLRTTGYMALIAIGPLLVLLAFGPWLFTLVFGDTWRIAGEFARIVSFAAAINFVVSPVSGMLSVSGNIRTGAMWKIVYFCTTAVTLGLATRLSIRGFLWVYAMHQLVLYGFYFYLILRAASNVKRRMADVV